MYNAFMRFLTTLSLAAAALLGGWASPAFAVPGEPPEQVNVLVITIDTIRPDRLGCYGSKHLETPEIDRLASSGVVFERAFAHSPITLPSHASLFLGLLPPAHGVSENSKSVVDDRFLTLAEVLEAEGYATGAFVSAFVLDSRFGLRQGFDLYDDFYPSKRDPLLPFSERSAGKTLDAALDWLSAQKGKWFCWVHLWDPHTPYSPPPPYDERFKGDPYSGEVAYVDGELARLLGFVAENGGFEKTLVLLTGDHGEALGEHGESGHGYFAYNSTLWVPLIVAGPGIKPARRRDYVSHVDVLPTFCEILAVKKPAGLQGRSLTPLLRGGKRTAESIYFEALDAHINRGWAPLRGFIREGKKFMDSPIPEFYDLEKDFGETSNLASSTDLDPYKKDMADFLEKTRAPAEPAARTTDRATREKLRSLGYVAAPVSQVKTSYGPGDDLKTLLPFEQRLQLAAERKETGRIAESVKVLEDIIRERPDFINAYFRLSEVYSSQNLLEESLGTLERGFRANDRNFSMLVVYGIVLINSGRYEKGIEIMKEAVSLFDRDAEVWNYLGVAYWRTGDFEKGKAHFEMALELDPDDALYNGNMGAFYVATALKTRSAADVERSLPYFEKAIAADPALASSYNGYGGALRILGRTDEAVANWERAVELNPKFDFPVYNLALAYLERGDKDRALEYCQRYLEIKGSRITPEERKDILAVIEKCKRAPSRRE